MTFAPTLRRRVLVAVSGCLLLMGGQPPSAHAEAMVQLFNVSWAEITKKMPELAEAGYGSIWVPPPTKGSGGLSVGYDMWDPFDLGSKDQRSTVRTRYGTEAELLQMIETAHRFGIRIYLDNIMNHRAFDVPGYDENTATGGEGQAETYPGMVPEDFHLKKTEDGFYRKWDNCRDWGSSWQVQNLGLADLIDIAQEGGDNANFGLTEGSTHKKYSFVRDLNRPEQYDKDKSGNQAYFGVLMDQARADLIAGGTNNPTASQVRDQAKSYIQANRTPFIEDVGGYLIRAARWEIDRTKADGLRLDAVKHVPDYFFGQQSGANKDSSDAGYLGGVQWQFNRTRGFSDTNQRDSVFEDKKGRDDAMVFGEHLGSPPGYSGYLDAGMRLVDNDLRSKLNGTLGSMWASLSGLDTAGYGGFAPGQGVMHATSHDNDYAAQIYWQHAYYMFREGMGLIYSDGYYQAATLGESGGAFPRHANTQYLGQYSDPRIPNILKIHNDFARGLQQGRWSDNDYVAFERRDNRDKFGTTRSGTAADEITMVAMFNDNTAQGQARAISTSFPAGAYLYQYAEGPSGSYQTGFYKYAWELGNVVVPPGGYFVFGYRTPELSTLWPESAITLYQNGQEVPRITVTRKDGPDGDKSFNPYNLTNRGYPTNSTPADFSYQTTIPVVNSNSLLTIVARADGSAENIMLKLDGGVDLNSHLGLGDTNEITKRDYPPGVYSDVWVGLEQPLFAWRQYQEKFAALDTTRCKTGDSGGAETYIKTIGGGFTLNQGPAGANTYSDESGRLPTFIYHNPGDTVGGIATPPKQFDDSGSDIVIWAQSNDVGGGYRMFVYYTTDGTYPEGMGGFGKGTTKVAELGWRHNQTVNNEVKNWWASASIPKPASGEIRYKIGGFKGTLNSEWPSNQVQVDLKKKMLTTFRVDNFNPATIVHFPHNDYARVPDKDKAYDQWAWATQTGLSEGFHVIRGRAFLNRNADTQAALYNTFTQTFYYDADTPQGAMVYPGSNGDTVGGSSYEMVIRTDPTVEEVWYHIDDSELGNNDSVTRQLNGNGPGFEPFTDGNQDGVRNDGEAFTDVNGNGVYDASLDAGWAKATEVTPSLAITSPYQKEWRFRYNNVPATGQGTVTFRLLEASSSRNLTLNAATAHVRELTRTLETRGPDERVNIAWPQSDGDRVDDNYTMKVYFTKALSWGISESELKNRITFYADGVAQDRTGWKINTGDFGANGAFYELAIPLPNLYNDVADFLHTLRVAYRFPDDYSETAKRGLVIDSVRLVKANPSTKPFVRITQPSELGSDGKPTEIVVRDVAPPKTDELYYTIRVEASATVTDLQLTGSPAIELFTEPFNDANNNGVWDDAEASTDTNKNGAWDGQDEFTDANSNGIWDVGETLTLDRNGNGVWDAGESYTDVNGNGICDGVSEMFADTNGDKIWQTTAETFNDTNGNGIHDGVKITVNGSTKTWDYTWHITAPGNYLLTATATLAGQSTSTVRNARVILRQVVDADLIKDNDDDNDGLTDNIESTAEPLPSTNTDTWTDDKVHLHYVAGHSSPTSPDTDGDGLPDGLELGWRAASNPPTDPAADTNGDGIPNFIGDLDPPFYAVVGNNGKVPGVGSASQGDDRSRQAAGSVTDPSNPDTDGDGLPDGLEDANHNGWVDGDGQSIDPTWDPWLARKWPNDTIDADETWTETSPSKADSDGDGLSDGYGEDKNFNGYIDGDTNKNRVHNTGEQWTETDPLKWDTDGDGLPDGWEVKYGLDPLDDGAFSKRLDGQGDPRNGAAGDPDGDGSTNIQELNSGTNPTLDDRIPPVKGEGSITIGTFNQWKPDDLLVLDEYKEGGSQGDDVYRSWNDTDNSRDIVAFSFRDGGDSTAVGGGDDRVYFRIDFMDLASNAWQGEVNAYIVINTGNPGTGEAAMPNKVNIVSDMKWQAVVAVYGQNYGSIFLDKNPGTNTANRSQNPETDGGVVTQGFGGLNRLNEVAWSSRYDAVEISIDRNLLQQLGWSGDPDKLNFQVFTTKPDPGGTGAIAGRNAIRDTIYDDWIVSDYWKDADKIALPSTTLSGYFGREAGNDRNKSAKVMLVAHGNQAIQPASTTQALIRSGTPAVGYSRLLQTHEAYNAPLTLHLTPTLASALQWAVNPNAGAWPNNDGPTFNSRLKNLIASGGAALVGSTFSDHIPKYFLQEFNNENKALAENFLDGIYGTNAASRNIFWAPERVLDTTSLATIYNMGYRYVFADQMRHFLKWFGRSAALGTEGYRINEVNGMKVIPIHDVASSYLDQTQDEGSSLAVRQLLSRRSRSTVQDQVVVFWRDMGDFSTDAKCTSYDSNVRWLGSRPWVRVVTPQQIADGQIQYPRLDNGQLEGNWGTIGRGTNPKLTQTAKDWIDHATQENYDNWYNGSSNEEGLKNKQFPGTSTAFGQTGLSNTISHSAWVAAYSLPASGIRSLAHTVLHSAMLQTAFHGTANNDLSKFSTGDYIYPDTGTGQTLADFARFSQSQARFAKIYDRVRQWNSSATGTTLGKEQSDVDLDGAAEYLLFNSRVFAVFEAKGGRMTAAWLRDPSSGKVWQVAGNFASYSNTDTEDEGASNFVGTTTALNAYRTSGFKDWWKIGGNAGAGANNDVNAAYSVSDAPSGTGWTFSQGGISKTISLPDAWSGNITAAYVLSGPTQLYVRFGLSPNLLDLMKNGQANLGTAQVAGGRVNLVNTTVADGSVRAFVQTSTNSSINSSANDSGGASFTTVNMRNQAQTQQVEVQITGSTTVTLGFDQGTDLTQPTDSDGDGMDDSWETSNFGDLSRNGTGDADSDGLTDLQEFILGSDPKNATSGRPATGVARISGGFRFSFPTVSGRSYQVQVRDEVSSGSWTNTGTQVAGDDSVKTHDDLTLLPRRFYRVIVSKP